MFDNKSGTIPSVGTEYPAVVEFSPYQKVPKKLGRKADPRCGTVETGKLGQVKKLELLKEHIALDRTSWSIKSV